MGELCANWQRFRFPRYHQTRDGSAEIHVEQFAWDERYRVPRADETLTPALVVYPEMIASNIASTLKLLDGDANRWRAHIKTAKLDYTLRMLIESGVCNFKCATTLELLVACRSAARDILMAYPALARVSELGWKTRQV